MSKSASLRAILSVLALGVVSTSAFAMSERYINDSVRREQEFSTSFSRQPNTQRVTNFDRQGIPDDYRGFGADTVSVYSHRH